MPVDLLKRYLVLDRQIGLNRYVLHCTERSCYPQDVHWNGAGLTFTCFHSRCPMGSVAAGSSTHPGEPE